MRSGKLRHIIGVERWDMNPEPNEYGTAEPRWRLLASLRAEIVQISTAEFMRNGAVDETIVVFRTRFLRWWQGLEPKDCIVFADKRYAIKEVKEIGMQQGLEIRCARVQK